MQNFKQLKALVTATCFLSCAGFLAASQAPSDKHEDLNPPAQQKAGRSQVQSTHEPGPAKPAASNDTHSTSASGSSQSSTPSRWSRAFSWFQDSKSGADTLKGVAELLAYGAALSFFFFKVYGGGYLTANLSVKITCQRQKSLQRPMNDYLSVVVTLKKGASRTLQLLCGEVRVELLETHASQQEPLRMKRVYYHRKRILRGARPAIKWNLEHPRYPFLFMPPGDESQFACHFEVPSLEPCRVEALIFGRSKVLKVKTSQWRASDISLPMEQTQPPVVRALFE